MKTALAMICITIFSYMTSAQNDKPVKTDTIRTEVQFNGNITQSSVHFTSMKQEEPIPERKSDDSFFSGSFLGALLSGLAAIIVFMGAEFINYRRKKKKNRLSIDVIVSLLQASVDFLNKYIGDLEKLNETYEGFSKDIPANMSLPYRVPYSITRLKDFNLEYLAELMSTKKIDNFPELLTTIDHIYLYIQELNRHFADAQERMLKLKLNATAKDCSNFKSEILEIYKYLLSNSEKDIENLNNAKNIFIASANKLKK